jgi:hypothetical protein
MTASIKEIVLNLVFYMGGENGEKAATEVDGRRLGL